MKQILVSSISKSSISGRVRYYDSSDADCLAVTKDKIYEINNRNFISDDNGKRVYLSNPTGRFKDKEGYKVAFQHSGSPASETWVNFRQVPHTPVHVELV